MNELFEIPPCDSPRLRWLKLNLVSVGRNEFTPTHSDDFRFGYSMVARCPTGVGYGNTDDEAIVDLAKKQGWKLWNEE